ncbi:MAG: proteasome subunit beta [Promethearchaeota archaeon]
MLLIYGGGMATGIVCKDGVAVGADKRYAFSNLIASKRGKKVHLIADRIGWASTGIIADIQYVTRVIVANNTLYTLENQRTMSVRATVKLLSNFLYGDRFFPKWVEPVVGGYDLNEKKAHLYSMDAWGSLTEERFAAAGTGATFALGLLEDAYKPEMSLKEGGELLGRVFRSTLSRDSASGGGFDILLISEKGAEWIHKEIPELKI